MPHIVIEYSSNLREKLNIEGFVEEVHGAALRTQVFPLGGTITRTIEHNCYRIADGDPENAFVRVTMRIRPGRTMEIKRGAGEKVFAAICNYLAPISDSAPLGIFFEVQENDPNLTFGKNNLHDYVKTRGLAVQSPDRS
jgi:5-carboxymethyl-2-hydroxymuconate isomerase